MSIKVFAPASIGNVSVGFDVLGMAVKPVSGHLLGDVVEIETAVNGLDHLTLIGDFADKLPKDPKDNIVWDCLTLFNQRLPAKSIKAKPVLLTLDKRMPVGSGLGSSACSVVAALVALNEFYEKPFNRKEMLLMMGEMEAKISGSLHYDNVAPCYYGGLQLMVSDTDVISQPIPPLAGTYWVMAYPGIEMSTKEARDALPEMYSRADLIQYGQSLASFVDASHRQDTTQALAYIKDIVAEPYRKSLLPKFSETKEYLMNHGAEAAGISGSGPTLFAVCKELSKAVELSEYLEQHYIQSNKGFIHICQIDVDGASVLQE